MLRGSNDHEKRRRENDRNDRGGEAPMEIDSPPPLWLKSPASPITVTNSNGNDNGGTLSISTPHGSALTPISVVHTAVCNTPYLDAQSSPMVPASSPSTPQNFTSAPAVGNNSNALHSSPLNHNRASSNRTSPVSVSSAGKSPLRSCHTNGDALVQFRRLNTMVASFSSPPLRSPTMNLLTNRRPSASPNAAKKRSSKGLVVSDPTKEAAAAAMFSSSSTAWHLHLPIILMNYFQFFFNTLIGLGVLYLIFSATRTVLHDAQLKVDERLQVMMAEISLCSRQYVENRCSPDMRVPAMEKACMEWETCMSRDPASTSRARLHAETIAEILNGFFGAISTKTYVFMISGGVLVVILFNFAFYLVGRLSSPTSAPAASGINPHSRLDYPSLSASGSISGSPYTPVGPVSPHFSSASGPYK